MVVKLFTLTQQKFSLFDAFSKTLELFFSTCKSLILFFDCNVGIEEHVMFYDNNYYRNWIDIIKYT